jgi:putative membrane protein
MFRPGGPCFSSEKLISYQRILGSDMPSGASDHLANERTFLAWVRTSISVIVFGFVVAKFGITLREFLRVQDKAGQQSGMSLAIGMAFMLFGIFMAVASLARYHKTRQRLEEGKFEPASAIITVLGTVTAIFGTILIAYLFYTSRTL